MRSSSAIHGALSIVTAIFAVACTRAKGAPVDTVDDDQSELTSPPVTKFVVLAQHGAEFAERTVVSGGSVGVAAGTHTAFAGRDSRVAVGNTLLAPRVVLDDRSVVGDVAADRIDASRSARTGARGRFVPPPAPPQIGTFTAGSTTVSVGAGRTLTLSPGKFGAVDVVGTLKLRGGIYELRNLRVGRDGRLIALAPSTVRITGGLNASDRAIARPNAPLGARDLRFIVAGSLDSNGTSVRWGADGQLTAFVIAQGGFRAADRFIGTGAIAARDVTVGADSHLSFEGGFACGSPSHCDDGNPCTVDACVDAQCTHDFAPNGTACDDGNACTQIDSCQAGLCTGASPVVCRASDNCHGAGTCDPTSGLCSNPALADGAPCSDQNACTRTDTCKSGACVGSDPVVCMAMDACHFAGMCDPATGACASMSKPDGTRCDDGDTCTLDDACRGGSCKGTVPEVTEMATGLRNPAAITAGPDGALWFVSPETHLLANDGSVGRLDPNTGALTTFAAHRFLGDIITGPDGNLWLRDGLPIPDGRLPSIGRMTSAGESLAEFAGIETRALAASPDGNVWFTGAGNMGDAVGRITAGGTDINPFIYGSNATRAIAAGPDGNMWITESNDGAGQAYVARITVFGSIREFPVDTNGNLNDIAAGPDGNIWFTDAGRNEIGRITPSGTISKFAIPTSDSIPFGLTAGADGNLYFTERLGNKIGRVTASGSISEICIPTAVSGPSSLTSGSDGNIWFTEFGAGNIGRLRL